MDDFIGNTEKQWTQGFEKENFLHLNEPLLRKEGKYYLVNVKPELATALHEVSRLYQIPNFTPSAELEQLYQHIDRFQEQFIDLGKSHEHTTTFHSNLFRLHHEILSTYL